MKRLSAIFFTLLTVVILTVSCSETKEADDHANWNARNREYIDNIASQCGGGSGSVTPEEAAEGQLFRILSYKLDPEKEWDNQSYVYCRVITKSADTLSPRSTDSVRINYRVRLIPTDNYPDGQVVDQSFKTATLDPSVNIPSSFCVSGLVDGVSTALMYMHRGDFWRLYIPQELAYGDQDKSSIPAYSTIIFDVNLTEMARTGQSLTPR